MSRTLPSPRATAARLLGALACALVLSTAATATAATPTLSSGAAKPPAAATIEQCVTAVEQAERSVTFVGEMTAVPGTARMLMRIEVQQRTPREALFHAVSDPGIGQWLRAAPGVHTYRNLDKVTNLTAPAVYRAEVHFRWLNGKGHLIKTLSLRTGRCDQPAPPTASAPASAVAGAGAATSG